ncbi:hypothetical protein K466DRAFT_586979 [Polyporus arcularius HHB13444]|uniref:Uncharacterized protein n=1 Tax=Polyporus arcularius HHB13444 TaxID=1314778 RepID=A0A5C3PL61_9APHY|nr:hypothetical protein K466DRAFT_586979 [Polyporus arcularius HHB13444]
MPPAEVATLPTMTGTTNPATGTRTQGPELLAYRYKDQTVYVVPAESYEQAIDFAQSVFPELVDIARDRISICVNGQIGKQGGHIRIAPMAWGIVIAKLSSFEILDVVVQPSPPHSKGSSAVDQAVDVKHSMSHDDPPGYEEQKSSDEELRSTRRLRSTPSTSTMSAFAKALFGKRVA